MNTGVLTVSDTLDVYPFPVDVQDTFGPQDVPSPVGDDAIRARLADVARQDEKRRRLSAFFERDTPAWNPDDHPDIDAAGGAAEWVRKLRSEAEQGFKRRTRRD
jgi:hypothetical protein